MICFLLNPMLSNPLPVAHQISLHSFYIKKMQILLSLRIFLFSYNVN